MKSNVANLSHSQWFELNLHRGKVNIIANFLLQQGAWEICMVALTMCYFYYFIYYYCLCITCNLSAGVYHSSLPRQRKSQILLCQWAAFRFTQVLLREEPHSKACAHQKKIHMLIGYTECLDSSQYSREILTHYAVDMLAGELLKLRPVLWSHQRIYSWLLHYFLFTQLRQGLTKSDSSLAT